MLERDIQQYLYDNPHILFPDKEVSEKSKEYYIKGKRIDLLFTVEGVRYIVEIKNKSITREHIGQVIEYYGLMKRYLNETNLKLILVSSDFPEHKKEFLEDIGIRCVHFDQNQGVFQANSIDKQQFHFEPSTKRSMTNKAYEKNRQRKSNLHNIETELRRLMYSARQNEDNSDRFFINIAGPQSEFHSDNFKGIVILSYKRKMIIHISRDDSFRLRDLTFTKKTTGNWLKKPETKVPPSRPMNVEVVIRDEPGQGACIFYSTINGLMLVPGDVKTIHLLCDLKNVDITNILQLLNANP